MPVTAQVRGMFRDDDEMPDSGCDHRFAPRAGVGLACLIGLDGVDDLVTDHPKNPQSTRANVTRVKTTTRVTSTTDRLCLRNGLKPMGPVFKVGARDASITVARLRV